ncbi:hypothetical protein OKW30_003403 [Paraburkholderia sp. Clong3]
MSFLVSCTAWVVSDASSSTMYSTFCPPICLGSSATVSRAGMPSDAAGPVSDSTRPIFTCANDVSGNAQASAAHSVAARRAKRRPR